MSVTYAQKTKTPLKVEAIIAEKAVNLDEVTQIVEEMATLKMLIDEFTPIEKRYDKLKKELQEKIPDDASSFETYNFMGISHIVVFSERPLVRTITDVNKVRDKLGEELFMQIVKVGLTELDKYLSEEEQADVVMSANTGARRCAIKEMPK